MQKREYQQKMDISSLHPGISKYNVVFCLFVKQAKLRTIHPFTIDINVFS